MDLADLRRLIITAIASDDLLVERLVLKGGNALELIHRIGQRASLDLDYSMDGDFDDVEDGKSRLFRALRDRFDAAGHPSLQRIDLGLGLRPIELRFRLALLR